MLATLFLSLSVLLQVATVVLVLRLIPLSRARLAWVLISAAILVRTVRISIQLGLVLGGYTHPTSVLDEGLACLASLLLFVGAWTLAPLFQALRNSERQLQELLVESRNLQRAAQEANKAKDEFLAGVSHELRTPLTVLSSSLELLESPSGIMLPQALAMSRDATATLARLIEDLLDSAQIGAGRMKFVREPYSPRDCLNRATRFFMEPAREKGLELTSSVAAGVPEFVIGDGGRVVQVLNNLLDNALKFTREGRIRVVLSDSQFSDRGGRGLLFQVADTGCGIPTEKVDHVFQNFYQADMSPTRLYRGMGLGLGLSQALVEGMGGQIWIETTGPSGTTINFILPWAPIEAPDRDAAGRSGVVPGRSSSRLPNPSYAPVDKE